VCLGPRVPNASRVECSTSNVDLLAQVGVDNMVILVHAVKRQEGALPLEERVGSALAEVGPSILLASLSEVLAFAVGIVTPMPACRVFSMFAGKKFFFA
jgi:Niemann-Pick C1 protein